MPEFALPVIFKIEEESLGFAGSLVSLVCQEVGDLVSVHDDAVIALIECYGWVQNDMCCEAMI